MKIKRITLVISILLIMIGVFINIGVGYKTYLIEKKEIDSIACFIENNDKGNIYNYIALLEIPKISLKRGINKDSTVDSNISILNYDSVVDGNIIIAGHSGNCDVCYFNDLDKLDINDIIYFYYDDIKYVYNIINIEIKKKNTFDIDNGLNKITLITCKKDSNDMQIIITGELIRKEEY